MNTELVLRLCNRTTAAACYESEVVTVVWLKICVSWEGKLQHSVAVPDVPKNTVPSKHRNVLTKWRSITSQRTWIFSCWYPGYSKLCTVHQLAAAGHTELLSAVYKGPELYKGPQLFDIPNILRTKLLACFFQPPQFLKHNYCYYCTNYWTLTSRIKCMLSESLSVATATTNWLTMLQ